MNLEALKQFLSEIFAPMVVQMGIEPVEITESGARFRVSRNTYIERTDGIVCGQAISSISDTVGVLALCAHNSPQRMMTTVDMTTHFMRPLKSEGMNVEVFILSNGRRMATVRIEIRQPESGKLVSSSTCAYAYVSE